MAEKVILYTESDDARINAAVRAYEGKPQYVLPTKKRRKLIGGGGCDCFEIHRFVTNGATAGTFSVTYNIDSTDRTVTWNWNDAAADVQSDFNALSAYFGTVEVYGGDWPNVALYVKWLDPPDDVKGLDNWPTVNNASLTGGSGFMDKFSFAK